MRRLAFASVPTEPRLKKDSPQKEEMVASLLRVLHSGVQDSRLLPTQGNPRIDLFKKAFLRAGRFTTAFVRLDFDTRPNFGSMCTITLPRKGQLLSRLQLVTTMPDIHTTQLGARLLAGDNFLGPTFGWTNSLGHALLAEATLDIGGSRVERLDGRLLEMKDEFFTPLEKVPVVNRLLPRLDNGFSPGVFGSSSGPVVATTPLPFWFSCGDAGAFLPIDAMGADAVKLNITFAPVNQLQVSDTQVAVPPGTIGVGGDAQPSLTNAKFYQSDPAGTTTFQGVPASEISGVQLPSALFLGETYIMAEQIQLDRPEANRFRISDIRIPVIQHYNFDPVDSQGSSQITAQFKIPNPTRNLQFQLNRFEAPYYNTPFLASRDLSGADAPNAPWWPDASGLSTSFVNELIPGFSQRFSEPIQSLALVQEGRLIRTSSQAPSFYRSFLPSFEMRKSPWHNGQMYTIPFGLNHGALPPSLPSGAANHDKVIKLELRMQLHPFRGTVDPNAVPRYRMYLQAETYNMFRVQGSRGGLMFAY